MRTFATSGVNLKLVFGACTLQADVMLAKLGVKSVDLLTNNPLKVQELVTTVSKVTPLATRPTAESIGYLSVKGTRERALWESLPKDKQLDMKGDALSRSLLLDEHFMKRALFIAETGWYRIECAGVGPMGIAR